MPYNLSVAKKEINDALASGDFKDYDAAYLNGLILQITDIENSVQANFHEQMDFYEKMKTETFSAHKENKESDLWLEEITDQLKINATKAHSTCQAKTEKLLDKVKQFLNAEEANSGISNKKMQMLLNSILPHIEAVIISSNFHHRLEIRKKIDDKMPIYEACKALGGYFFPMDQAIDPLVGQLESKLKGERFREDLGKCDGFVKQGRDMIEKTGTPEYFPITHENTQYHMDAQVELGQYMDALKNMKAMDLSIRNSEELKSYMDKAIAKMQSGEIYKLGFMGSGGHSTRVRMIPGTQLVEYYEPNFGTFYFHDKEAFSKFFVLIINRYKASGTIFDKFFFLKIGENVRPEKIPVPLTAGSFDKNQMDESLYKHIKTTVLDLAFYYDELIEKRDMKPEDMRVICHDTVVTFISMINEAETLQRLESFFSDLSFSKQEEPDSKNLFLYTDDDLSSPSQELIGIRKAIAEKKLTLLNANTNLKETTTPQKESAFKPAVSAPSEIIKPIYFNTTEKSIAEFKTEAPIFFTEAKDILINLVKQSMASSQHKSIQLLLNDFILTEKALNENFNPQMAQRYLISLEQAMTKIIKQYKKDNKSSWTKDMGLLQQEINTELSTLAEKTKQFKHDYGNFSVTYSSPMAHLSNDSRIQLDKLKLSEIITKMRKAPISSKLFSSINKGAFKLFGKTPFSTPEITKKLQAILDTDYSSYQDLEKAIHGVNKQLEHSHSKKFKTLLDGFFKDHLGYKDYSRKNPSFSSSTLNEPAQAQSARQERKSTFTPAR